MSAAAESPSPMLPTYICFITFLLVCERAVKGNAVCVPHELGILVALVSHKPRRAEAASAETLDADVVSD